MKVLLLVFVLPVILAFGELSQAGADLKKVSRKEGFYKEVYHVLRNNPSVKEGLYLRYYKERIVEKGKFQAGEKIGNWRFYNLEGIFEYEFNYQNGDVIRLAGARSEPPYSETPCLFKGSPLDPYLFIVGNINYPNKAKDMDLTGRVVLGLKINKRGEVVTLYINEHLHPLLDSEVMRVAQTFPSEWEWLPATRHGKAVEGEYLIAIEFELE